MRVIVKSMGTPKTVDNPLPFNRGAPCGPPLFSLASQSAGPSLAPSPERAVPFACHGAEIIAFSSADRAPETRTSDPIRLLFVCRTHAVLSPMAEGLARAAYERLDIRVQSAGLSVDAVDSRAIAVMAEVDVDISQTPATAVRDLDLGSFDIVVSLGVHKLGVEQRQMAVAWDIPEFTRVTEATARPRLRRVRDALFVRVRALGAVLTATNRA